MEQQKDHQRNAIMATLKNLKDTMGEEMSFEKFVVASVESIMMSEWGEYLHHVYDEKWSS